MKKLALLAFCIVLGAGGAWAQITLVTNPGGQDYIDWCQFGCTGANFPSPQAWTSGVLGFTGTVGLNGGFQNFYNLQQGTSWFGNFNNGMGLIYNGAFFGNTPTGIVTTFDQGMTTIGAYIQTNFYGPFTANLTLFDQNSNPLGTVTELGVADGVPGTTIFIGAYVKGLPYGSIFSAQFDAIDQFGTEDFAIGQAWMTQTPEPGTLILFGTSALGLAGYLRRRFY